MPSKSSYVVSDVVQITDRIPNVSHSSRTSRASPQSRAHKTLLWWPRYSEDLRPASVVRVKRSSHKLGPTITHNLSKIKGAAVLRINHPPPPTVTFSIATWRVISYVRLHFGIVPLTFCVGAGYKVTHKVFHFWGSKLQV
jgi:hypothetical protein